MRTFFPQPSTATEDKEEATFDFLLMLTYKPIVYAILLGYTIYFKVSENLNLLTLITLLVGEKLFRVMLHSW